MIYFVDIIALEKISLFNKVVGQIRNGFGNKHFLLEVFDIKHKFLEPFDDGFFVKEELSKLVFFR
jgi:hypothetical protein